MSYAIETSDLHKAFKGGVEALAGLDLAVSPGSVYGLIGRNGAGKTTAIRLLAGILRPNSGFARIHGIDMMRARPEDRAKFAYVSQRQQLPHWHTVRELGVLLSPLYPTWDSDYLKKLCEHFSIDANRTIQDMSGGEQRKAAVALAFAARPKVLLMDEPAAGLDPVARRELIDAIVALIGEGNDSTILFSTHILADLERIADTVGIIRDGRMMTSAELDTLQTSVQRIQIVAEGAEVPADIQFPQALSQKREGPVLTVVVPIDDSQVLSQLESRPDLRVNVFPLSLEETFIHLVGKEPALEEVGV